MTLPERDGSSAYSIVPKFEPQEPTDTFPLQHLQPKASQSYATTLESSDRDNTPDNTSQLLAQTSSHKSRKQTSNTPSNASTFRRHFRILTASWNNGWMPKILNVSPCAAKNPAQRKPTHSFRCNKINNYQQAQIFSE
jgi:hypothetical protein